MFETLEHSESEEARRVKRLPGAVAIALFLLLATGSLLYLFQVFFIPAEHPETLRTQIIKIKGNRQSKIYHLPGCPNYNDIAERNIILFKSVEEAESASFRMARNCP